MDTVITFTPMQLIGYISAICGVIISAGAVVTLIIKLINKVRAPEAEQDRRIKELEEDNKKIRDEIKEIKNKQDTGDDQFRELEKSNKIILRSLQALLRHSLGIADSGALTDAMNELDDYLLEK